MKLIIFDFDGTIADSMWAWDDLGENTLKENNIPLFSDYRDVIRTMSVLNFSSYLTKRFPELGDAKDLMDHWHDVMEYKYTHEVKLKKGIVEFLELLKSKGYILYLASATKYEVLMKAVKHFDLEKYFSFIITETIVGISKRDPKIYKLCEEKANVSSKDIRIFEDADHAIKTAKAAGYKVCAIEDKSMVKKVDYIKKTADLYLEDFTDTNKLLKFIEE